VEAITLKVRDCKKIWERNGAHLEVLQHYGCLDRVFKVDETVVELSTALGLFNDEPGRDKPWIGSENVFVRGGLRATSRSLASIGMPSIYRQFVASDGTLKRAGSFSI
jgi:hypothetical protein